MKKGFQSLEREIKKIRIEGGGFCVMWSLFVMEMVLNNPNKSTLQIIEKVMDITKKDPQYLSNIIRGYVVGVEKTLDETFKFLKKEGFSYSALKSRSKMSKVRENVEDDMTTAFILDTIFETEKEVREKKQYKPLPPKKQKERTIEDELFELLMKKTKKELSDILFSLRFSRAGSPDTKEQIAHFLSTSERVDKEEIFNILTA